MDLIQQIILDTPDLNIMDIDNWGFKEFCENLDILDQLSTSEVYIEEVTNNKATLMKPFKGTIKNTADTTIDLVSIYGGLMSGNASVIKGFWDLFMKLINLGLNVILFILGKITTIPILIMKVGDKVGSIPDNIANKIQGNIKVYITIPDIESLYNNQLLNKLTTFISLSRRLAEGDTWGTFFRKRKGSKGNENDIKISKEMKAIYAHLKTLKFTQTTIFMSHTDAFKQYFGQEKSIHFVDLHGKKHNDTYYEALTQLVEDIKAHQDDLKVIQQSVSSKYTETYMNQEFSKLTATQRDIIVNSVQMISRMLKVTGDIVKYIIIDMQTIEKETSKILNAAGVKSKK